MSAFGADQGSLDSLIHCAYVSKSKKDSKGDRIINRKVYNANLEAIRTYVSELGMETLADSLPSGEDTMAHWVFHLSGISPSFAPAAWAFAEFPCASQGETKELQEKAYNRITNADNSGDDSRSRESQDRRSAERSRTSESDASRARKEGRNRGKRSRGRSRSRHEKKSPVLRRARRERQERSRREKDPKQEGVPEPEPTGKGDDSAPAKTKEEAGSSNREKAERRKETRKDRSGRKDKEKGGPLRIELPAFKEEKDEAEERKGKKRPSPDDLEVEKEKETAPSSSWLGYFYCRGGLLGKDSSAKPGGLSEQVTKVAKAADGKEATPGEGEASGGRQRKVLITPSRRQVLRQPCRGSIPGLSHLGIIHEFEC